jgi:hypothetical protein
MTNLIAELAEVVRDILDGDGDVRIASAIDAANFLRNHHATLTRIIESGATLSADYEALVIRLGEVTGELEKARKDAESWRLCTSDHTIDDETIKCHVNVGVNVWRGNEWLSFHQCTPDELRRAFEKHAAMHDSARER